MHPMLKKVSDKTTILRSSPIGVAKDYNSDNGVSVRTKTVKFLGGGVGLEQVSLIDNGKIVSVRTDHSGYYSACEDIMDLYCDLVIKKGDN